MGPLLDIRELEVRFGAVDAVRGVSLNVDEGEVLGLVGESGSGKSATALAIMGLLPPTARRAAQILWRSADEGSALDLLQKGPERMRHIRGREIAIIFQKPMTALNPVMTVGRQVTECAEAHAQRLTHREAKRKAIAAMKQWRFPMQPSGTAIIRTSFQAGSGRGF
jgi:ABC-type glutathione transport system ATPase component